MTAATNNFMANRNSTPEISRQGSLQLPSSRNPGTPTAMRTSADMSGYVSSPLSGRPNAIRPSSEVYSSQSRQSVANEEAMDKAAQQWLADIDQYENTLEDMATATLDQEFKDELSAIEQWFKVLSEPERTAALYQLLQQTTQLQIRFFIQVLQEMAKSNPIPGVQNTLTDKEAHRASDATGKLGTTGDRNSLARPTQAGSAKRNSGLDASTINAMFPHAADAIAKRKAEYTEQTGVQPVSNRNSTAQPDRNSLAAPTISTTPASTEKPSSPWVQRPTSATGQIPVQAPMGQFAQPPPQSAGLRSPQTGALPNSQASHLRATELTAPINEMPILSPYNLTGSWASMTNTPMIPNFNLHPAQADLIANATASKLAALSTVNNRVMLDDPRKYRRARSNDGGSASNISMNSGMATNVLVVNEAGQLVNSGQLNASQLAALQSQNSFRPRPNSPFGALSSGGLTSMSFSSPQTNGFLSAYDSSAGLPTAMTGLSLGGFGLPGEGYISDHSDMNRGRSPRGRRGTSKAPEDPTDLALLNDIPAWLRMLRLHKYTDNLKDVPWMELVNLDEQGLDDKGVNALGARRKMLKAFEQVKEAQAKGDLPSPTKAS